MRYLTVLIEPVEQQFVSVFDTLDEEVVTRERLYHFNFLSNGTVVLLYQLQGDLDYARAIFDTSPTVLQYDVPESGGGLAYLHCEVHEPLSSLLSELQDSAVIMTMPVAFLSDSRLRVTFIGSHESLHHLLTGLSEFLDVEVEEIGEYGSKGHLGSLLTDRQREILTVAVEHGYYKFPRQATLRDITGEVGLSQATVGEHLQKIEAKLLSRAIY